MPDNQYTTKEIDARFADFESRKADRAAVSVLTSYGIAAFVGIASAIAGLYVLYYSGLARLETSVAVLSTKVEILSENVSTIQKILNSAEITK